MSALAMILTAAMAVSGDGAGNASMEVVHGLDLNGIWEGNWKTKEGEIAIRIDPKVIAFESDQGSCTLDRSNMIDEGCGKLLFRGIPSLYRQESNLLIICFSDAKSRPLAIGAEYGHLLILHRVKARK
jgi:hypothetical protein